MVTISICDLTVTEDRLS